MAEAGEVREVCVLGTGRMGAAMVRRLVGAGHRVRAWNRTPSAVTALLGALGALGAGRLTAAGSPSAAVDGADVVLSVLADGDVTRSVLLDSGTLRALAPGTVVVDLGTSGVATARELGAALGAAGARFVDAPVSGSVPAVTSGALLVLASGAPDSVAAAEPVLRAFARKVIRVGDAGAGQVMKLAVNLVVHDLNTAVSEALRLAENSSISRDDAYSVLQESVVGAPFVQYKRAAFLDPATPVAMSLRLVEKDLRLITEHARAHGEAVPMTETALACVGRAVAAGLGSRDMADLSRIPAADTL
jgi:3-hydroxyisobutyrate dehydrogenase-like beta-hydroxyacid dehydrogenase